MLVSQHSTPGRSAGSGGGAPVPAGDDSGSDADSATAGTAGFESKREPLPASRKRAHSSPVSEKSGRTKAKARHVDKDRADEVSPPPAKKSVSAKKQKRGEEPPPGSESDSEGDKRSKSRYVSVKCSDILTGQLISKDHITQIRQQFQMAMICHDGIDLQDGAGNRALNFHLALRAAKDAKLPKDVCKRFCRAMKEARVAGKEDQ